MKKCKWMLFVFVMIMSVVAVSVTEKRVVTAASVQTANPVGSGSEYGASSKNLHQQGYVFGDSTMGNCSSTVKSYLVDNGNGTVSRIEAIGSSVVIEDYGKQDFSLKNSEAIAHELPIFGGFYAGEKYNYLVYGQGNDSESDAAEVVRVVQYSKEWKRIKSGSLYGSNTTIPFWFGSLRMCELGDELYIRTCHQRYTSSDGLRHQAGMTMCFDQVTGSLTDAGYLVAKGCVSHSFNQFIRADGEDVIAADHGDANPRSIILDRYRQNTGSSAERLEILSFPGETGDNYTGAALGGLEASDTKYLVAYQYVDPEYFYSRVRNVYLAVADKSSMSPDTLQRKQFTQFSYNSSSSASNPVLVKTGENEFYLMWEIYNASKIDCVNCGDVGTNTIQYVKLDGEGNALGDIRTAEGALSDCAPLVMDGQMVWYVTDGAHPAFYSIDLATGALKRTYKEPPILADNPTIAPTGDPAATQPPVSAKPSPAGRPRQTAKPTASVRRTYTTSQKTIRSGSSGSSSSRPKKVGKVSGLRVTGKWGGKFAVRWAKAKRAEVYVVQIAENRRFTKRKRTVNVYSKKCTLSGLRKGKTYYVRVRGYDYSRYGAWSGVKKCRAK